MSENELFLNPIDCYANIALFILIYILIVAFIVTAVISYRKGRY
jgi:hypothetical protein